MKKKGRPKRGDGKDKSDDEEFVVKGKRQGLKKLSKLEEETESEMKEEAPSSPVGFKIKKKKKLEDSDEEKTNTEAKDRNILKSIKYTLDKLNFHKIFEEIIESAYKENYLMFIIKNILSTGKLALNDKTAQLKKKWLNLKNSNLSEQEYRKKEKALQGSEMSELRDIKEDIYNKLCASKIKGFETREAFNDRFRKNLEANNKYEDLQKLHSDIVFEIQEKEYQKYKEDILELIDLLLEQKIFIEDADNRAFAKGYQDLRELKKASQLSDQIKSEKIEPEPAPRTYEKPTKDSKTQKTQRKKMTCLIGKYFLENDKKANDGLKNFNWNDFFNIKDKDKLMLKKSDVPVINSSAVERSSDEIHIHNHYDKCTQILLDLDKRCQELDYKPDYQALKEMIYLTNFCMYTIHSFQKYNLERPIIHPSDILHVLNKYS